MLSITVFLLCWQYICMASFQLRLIILNLERLFLVIAMYGGRLHYYHSRQVTDLEKHLNQHNWGMRGGNGNENEKYLLNLKSVTHLCSPVNQPFALLYSLVYYFRYNFHMLECGF